MYRSSLVEFMLPSAMIMPLKYSGADIVFKGREELDILKVITKLAKTGIRNPSFDLSSISHQPSAISNDFLPAFDLYPQLDYVCISTSWGCPFHCTYCATPILTKGFVRRDPFKVVEEIVYWTDRYQANNIAFYDDALLIDPPKHIIPIMKEVIKRGIQCNFHTPNALHIREIDEEVTQLLFRGGFKTIRLGFETSNEAAQIETGGKVDNQNFEQAVKYLKRAGYSSEEIGVYVMVGLPGQGIGEGMETIAFVKKIGAKPILVEYSPIPGTPLFEKAKQRSSFDLENEPLFHNNSILPCQWEGFTMADYKGLKEDLRR